MGDAELADLVSRPGSCGTIGRVESWVAFPTAYRSEEYTMPMYRYLAAAAVPLLLAATLAAPVASAKSASPSGADGYARLWNQQTDRCLDASVGGGVRLNECNYSEYQQWSFISNERIIHLASELCLDASTSHGVRIVNCNRSAYQQWFTIPDVPATSLKNIATGQCLDASISQGLRLRPCNDDSEYQYWQFVE
jgi:hypothetical protein